MSPAGAGTARLHVALGSAPLEVERLAEFVADRRAGAVATFVGVVRDHHAGKAVDHLEYEAYVPMAKNELRRVAEAAARRWPLHAIAVEHRIGRLEIGDAAVAIAVSSSHRSDAFDALRHVIDTLKQTVPIWKRETGVDGSHWIEGPEIVAAAPDDAD